MPFKYFRESFARKKARRFFKEYPYRVTVLQFAEDGEVEYADWKNPIAPRVNITQEEINFYKQFVKPGDFAIDIGANIGDTSVPIGIAACSKGLTLAFDPNPHVFKILEVNAGLNKNKTNIIPLNYAVTKEPGEFYYNSSEASFANGGISSEPSKHHGKFSLRQKIKGINLEDFLEENYKEWLPKLSFIKIDCEGYDSEIIRSIHPLIEKYHPAIVSECFTTLSKEKRAELFNSLAEKNYELFYFENFSDKALTEKIKNADEMNKWRFFNLYAMPCK